MGTGPYQCDSYSYSYSEPATVAAPAARRSTSRESRPHVLETNGWPARLLESGSVAAVSLAWPARNARAQNRAGKRTPMALRPRAGGIGLGRLVRPQRQIADTGLRPSETEAGPHWAGWPAGESQVRCATATSLARVCCPSAAWILIRSCFCTWRTTGGCRRELQCGLWTPPAPASGTESGISNGIVLYCIGAQADGVSGGWTRQP